MRLRSSPANLRLASVLLALAVAIGAGRAPGLVRAPLDDEGHREQKEDAGESREASASKSLEHAFFHQQGGPSLRRHGTVVFLAPSPRRLPRRSVYEPPPRPPRSHLPKRQV